MSATPTEDQLKAAFCWEADDQIPSRPQMTAFRQRTRYQQAQWREAHGHPIGSAPINRRPQDKNVRPVGSRMPLDYARETGANFVTPGALAAARARMSMTERHQSFDHQRTWAELLWSPALAFNLFGDLAGDLNRADRAVHAWWPDAPGTVSEIRFAHSPGRFDPSYLNSLRAFDAAFVLDNGDGTSAIVAVAATYHDRAKIEQPKPRNRVRNLEVANRARVFRPGAAEELMGRSEHAVMWLEHLLMSSMLQHESGQWTWGRYVVIHPEGNPDMTDLVARYRTFLTDESTFGSMTLEALLDADALPKQTTAALRTRYLR